MRKSLAVGLSLGLLGTALLAKAQEEPSKFDLYGGYYYARINVNANVPGIAPSAAYIGEGSDLELKRFDATTTLITYDAPAFPPMDR